MYGNKKLSEWDTKEKADLLYEHIPDAKGIVYLAD